MLKDPLAKFVLLLTVLTFFVAAIVPIHQESHPIHRNFPRYCTKGCPTYGIPKSSERMYLYECEYDEDGVLETVSENGEMICGVESNGLFTVRGIEGEYSTYSTQDF